MTHRPPGVLSLELNEADHHFLQKLVDRGVLPAFQRMIDEGIEIHTHVPGWDGSEERAWRDISPWIVWPSVYTGLTPPEHGLVGFGQDTSHIRGRCIWDVLDSNGISVGVFSNLMSHPPRTAGCARFYVPEALANDADCIPAAARPVQEFCIFTARNYSESFLRSALTATNLLLRTHSSGVSLGTIARTLWQVPAEKLHGPTREPERAMLLTYIQWEAFRQLYRDHRPAFATLHLNHIAYMQHRYWRAAEPERYRDELSETDRRFFRTVEERKAYESKLAHRIEQSFVYADRILAEAMEMVEPSAVILVASGLGQRPFDPIDEIHNPVVRLLRADELFRAIGLEGFRVLHQMNPDVTVSFADDQTAARAAARVRGLYVHDHEPLFHLHRRDAQLFLELNMPRRGENGGPLFIRHSELPDFRVELGRHIQEHHSNDQSSAHHKDDGMLLAWRKDGALERVRKSMPITDMAPTVLSLFGLPPQPWMQRCGPPALRLPPAD